MKKMSIDKLFLFTEEHSNNTSSRGTLFLISSKNFNPNFCALVNESSFFRSSSVRCPFSYSLRAVAGPMPQTSPNRVTVRTFTDLENPGES